MTGMQDQLPNGYSVNRIWGDDKAELIALFQYKNDAQEFALMKLASDVKYSLANCNYIVASTYSGKLDIYTRSALNVQSGGQQP